MGYGVTTWGFGLAWGVMVRDGSGFSVQASMRCVICDAREVWCGVSDFTRGASHCDTCGERANFWQAWIDEGQAKGVCICMANAATRCRVTDRLKGAACVPRARVRCTLSRTRPRRVPRGVHYAIRRVLVVEYRIEYRGSRRTVARRVGRARGAWRERSDRIYWPVHAAYLEARDLERRTVRFDGSRYDIR